MYFIVGLLGLLLFASLGIIYWQGQALQEAKELALRIAQQAEGVARAVRGVDDLVLALGYRLRVGLVLLERPLLDDVPAVARLADALVHQILTDVRADRQLAGRLVDQVVVLGQRELVMLVGLGDRSATSSR